MVVQREAAFFLLITFQYKHTSKCFTALLLQQFTNTNHLFFITEEDDQHFMFMVTFKVVEYPQNKLFPVITY